MDGITDLDSVEYRKYLWDKEYLSRKALPSSNTFNPSSSLRNFLEKHPNINKENALDIGCGNGRNCFYLVKNGFKHTKGIDISPVAINLAKNESKALELDPYTEFAAGDIGAEIEKESDKYDLIIDMMTLHALTESSRMKVIENIKRLLAPNGYYLLFTLMADSPAVLDLKKRYPGPEENSYRFNYEEDVITEKAFTKKELETLLSPLKLVEYEEYETVTKAYNGEFTRIYITCLFQNKV